MYRDARRNERVLKRRFPHLSPAQIKAALLYYARFPAEIDQAIEENAALTFATVEAKAPGLVQRV
jgi:hypothetical protein